MKIKWLVAIIAVVVVGILIQLIPVKSVKEVNTPIPKTINISTADISAAINYGRNHKDDLLVDFEKPWTVFLGYGSGKGIATIFTPYHYLALIARNSARDNSDMDTGVLCRLYAENYQDLYFEITLYGDDDGFDRDYKAVVSKDGREIPPLKILHQGYDVAREYTVSSQQKLYFPADILPEKGRIILRIIKPKEVPSVNPKMPPPPFVKPKEIPLDFVFDLKSVL